MISRALNNSIFLALSLLGFFVLVFPNSFRGVTLPVFLMLGLLIVAQNQSFQRLPFVIWGLGSIVTLVYALIGILNSQNDFLWQVLFVYLASPLIWMLIASTVVKNIDPRLMVRFLVVVGAIGALTVPLFYFFFIWYGAEALTWLIATPNVASGNGDVGATMHVFGPLLFIVAGFFAAPRVIEALVPRCLVMLALFVGVLLSGRTALLIAFLLGVGFYTLNIFLGRRFRFTLKTVLIMPVAVCASYFVLLSLVEHFSIDIPAVVAEHFQKVLDGGGVERKMQKDALTEGITGNLLTGSGHGVGVSVIRNEEYPWRYELLWIVTLFRVGLVGAIIYALPVIIIMASYLKSQQQKLSPWLCDCNNFLFVGFLSSFLGSFTNPYYESFEFQWMLFLPFIYFHHYYKINAAVITDLPHKRTISCS